MATNDEIAWTDWAGGACPVAPDALVDVRLRSGRVNMARRADGWNWRAEAGIGAIIGYRVAVPPAIAVREVPAAPADGVSIKGLEWEKAGLLVAPSWMTVRWARTPFGIYAVDKREDGRFRVTLCGQTILNCRPTSPDEGTAAGQADFERRIRSCLIEPRGSPAQPTDDGPLTIDTKPQEEVDLFANPFVSPPSS